MAFNQCIPNAIGVPFESGPPNWFNPAQPPFDSTLDDPRWRGASELSIGDGGSDETNFRALFHTDPATTQTSLYLSWQTRLDMDGTDNSRDKLYVGFIPDPAHGGSGPAFILELVLNVQPGQGDTVNGLNTPNFQPAKIYTRLGATWNTVSPDGTALGTWLADTRLWACSPTTTLGRTAIPWAFQLHIPIGIPIVQQGTSPTTSTLGTAFNMWYSLVVSMPKLNQAKQITWPSDGTNAYDVSGGDTVPLVLPPPVVLTPWMSPSWGTITVGSCPAQGISLNLGQIGTLNPLGLNIISLNKPNTLFATPSNNSTSPVQPNTLFARFRLANWGSTYTGATWDDIRGGSNVPNTSVIPAGTTLPSAAAPIQFNWTLTPAEVAKYQLGGSLNSHECMLVQITSTGPIPIDVDSVVQNMDFQNTSQHIEDAHISISGLPPTQDGHRDVYLYVERIDLPSHIESDPCRFDQKEENVEEARAELNRRALEGNLSLAEAVDAGFPTYRVHVYHSTGQKLSLGGSARDILHIQPSFGYFLLHDGPLFGWDHRLEGAIQLAPNYYKIPAIPDGQSAKVIVAVEALEQPRGARDSGFMVQSTVNKKGDFLVVVPDAKTGLSECTRSNDILPNLPWGGQRTFGADVGLVDSVSLIQSNYGPAGNFEAIARVGDRLVHFWRSVTPDSTWYGPTTVVDKGIVGNPAFIQGNFGIHGNFELVVPVEPHGIAHYWRSNDDQRPTWQLGAIFAEQLGKVDAVALIQSNFGQPGPGHLEVIARVGEDLYHIWRDSSPLRLWKEPVKFFSGAAGIPGFIQGNFGSKDDFEVVTPLARGAMAELRRNNDEPATFPWREVTTFGSGQVTAASLLQSNFTTAPGSIPGPGDFEVAARVGGRTAHYWRADEAPFTWNGPTAYACS